MDFLGNVANCKIEQICTLVPKQGQLRFIAGKNDRHYRCTQFVLLKLFLYRAVGYEAWRYYIRDQVKLTCVNHNHLPVCISWYMRAVLLSLT